MKSDNPIKIVFFDIDETLYIKAEKRIPSSISEQVIPRLKERGIIPAIATGRCIGSFPEALKPLLGEHGFELLVSINGQYNCYKEQLISHYPLDIQRIEQVIEQLNQLGIVYGLVSHSQVAVSAENTQVIQSLTPITADYVVDPQLYQHAPIYQLLAFFPSEQEAAVVATGILQEDLKIVRWHPQAVDLLSIHNSKEIGILDVLRHFKLTLSQTMAFGDGLNDLEMLASVGCGVAMGNAEPILKAKADYITLPIEQEGILYALEQLGVI